MGRGGTGYIQYGHQYSNYEPWPGGSQGGYGLSRPAQGTRLNDRDPANFSPHGNKPWNYNSGNRYENRGPTLRPDWRPDPNYAGNYNKDSTGKYPTNDKNEFQKPWTGHSGYGPSKPDSGNGFPYGGNRFPGSDGSTSPIHLFYPNDEHHEGSQSGFSSPGSRPGGHPSTGNQGSSYPIGSGVSRPSAGSLIYTGGRPAGYPAEGISHPSGGGHPGSYQSSSGGNYPISSVASHSNPSSGTYPDRGSRPESYPTSSSGGSYLDGGSRPGSYPSSSLGGSYPDGGNRPGSYPSSSSGGSYSNGGNRPGSYPSSSTGGSYPNGGNRPGNYPSSSSGGSYLGEGTRPTNYPSSSGGNYDEGRRPTYGYPGSGGRPGGVYITHGSGSGGYPSDGSSSGGYSYESSRPGYSYHSENFGNYGGYPDRYPGKFPDTNRVDVYSGSGGRPLYPSTGYSNYPSYGSGGKNPPKGYYTGIITEIGPDQGPYGGSQPNHFGGSYPGDKNAYPGVYKDHYPYGGDNLNKYPSDKHRFGEDRYSSGGDNDNYPGGRDRFYYYGQDMNKDQYPSGYPSSGSSGGGGFVGSDQNQGSSQDKNAWNYGDQKDGIYHRSGGSYPPYRGGQYYTSSYLASLTSTTQQGSESKTQSVTKTDEVTQPTSTQS